MKSALKKYIDVVGVCFGVAILGCVVFSRTAGAYAVGSAGSPPAITSGTVAGYVSQAQQLMKGNAPVSGTPSWLSGTFTAISQWFQNIVAQGAQSTGAPTPITFTGPLGSSITVPAQNLFSQFDTWLYGIIHFHIAIIVNFFFGLVGWILGIAKSAVDWLNSTFRSAAGK
jgi:hypothetical protein